MESRHPDVIEMDAASHNGVEDVRQINDAVRYAPSSARYKVYILDEVHMLSTQAFNALLKTLEEPPPHAKFVFATTETRKVPVTVLSRCQRFDLRRVDAAVLVAHLERIAAQGEDRGRAGGAGADRARRRGLGARFALAVRSGHRPCGRSGARRGRAADAGACRPRAHHRPVRGGDARRSRAGAARAARPIRHRRRSGGGAVRSRRVHPFRDAREDRAGGRRRSLARRGRTQARARLCREALHARARAHLADAAQGHCRGRGLGPAARRRRDGAGAPGLRGRSADPRRGDPLARRQGARRAARSATPARRRQRADDGIAAAARSARAEARAACGGRGRSRPASARAASLRAARRRRPAIGRFEDLVELAARKRDLSVKAALERDVRLVRCEDGRLEIALEPSAAKTLVNDLARKLSQWTGRRWMVVVSARAGRSRRCVAARGACGRS